MSLLSRIFGRKEPEKPIDEMSLAEVAAFLQGGSPEKPAGELIAVARRVTDLALFEHGLAEGEREVALRLLPALDADIEAGLQGEPGAFEAYQEAAEYHRGNARHCGYGSLHWLMEERGTTAAEVIPFIAREEHAELLPAYLEMMEPDVIHQMRTALLKELATSRARDGERPAQVFHRLATTGDGALTLLLDGRHLGAISRADREPEAAESTLRELGITLQGPHGS